MAHDEHVAAGPDGSDRRIIFITISSDDAEIFSSQMKNFSIFAPHEVGPVVARDDKLGDIGRGVSRDGFFLDHLVRNETEAAELGLLVIGPTYVDDIVV